MGILQISKNVASSQVGKKHVHIMMSLIYMIITVLAISIAKYSEAALFLKCVATAATLLTANITNVHMKVATCEK
jgi:hypothetical protein